MKVGESSEDLPTPHREMTEAQVGGGDRWREVTIQGKTGIEIYYNSLIDLGEDREHLLLPHGGFQQLLGTSTVNLGIIHKGASTAAVI